MIPISPRRVFRSCCRAVVSSVEKHRLPQDITKLLALCVRDLIWYKDEILSFLDECGVPKAILVQARRDRDVATIKAIPAVLEQLYEKGDDGFQVARTMLTKIYLAGYSFCAARKKGSSNRFTKSSSE